MIPKTNIVSEYFKPINKRHIEYINNAMACGDRLNVIVYSDHQLALKGSKMFQKVDESFIIVSNIKSIDDVLLSIDRDNTQFETFKHLHFNLNDLYQLAFARCGHQNNQFIPEAPVCLGLGIEGLEEKIHSSGWFLNLN